MPLQTPDQPTKYAPLPGLGVRVTIVPQLNEALHVGEQVIPAGVLVTVPVEVPASVTVSWYVTAGAGMEGAPSWANKTQPELPAKNCATIRLNNKTDLFGFTGCLRVCSRREGGKCCVTLMTSASRGLFEKGTGPKARTMR